MSGSLEKRKANVTFLGPDCVTITNFMFSKTFILKNECAIDLKSLKKTNIENGSYPDCEFPFFVYFFYSEEEDCYNGMMVFKKSQDQLTIDNLNIVSYKQNNKNFSASCWVEED